MKNIINWHEENREYTQSFSITLEFARLIYEFRRDAEAGNEISERVDRKGCRKAIHIRSTRVYIRVQKSTELPTLDPSRFRS